MKILLIVPNIKSYDTMPSLSVATLKGFINEKTEHEAKIIDLVFHKKHWKTYLGEKIRKEKPGIIGISVLSFNYPEALQITRFIKENFDLKIILGGVHVILSPQEVIENGDVDIICTGEGENVLKELLDNSLNCTEIEGIWYKHKGKIIKNKPRKLIEDLDGLPFPDFEDFDLEHYFVINHHHLPVMGSRGCPYSCTYCGNHALRKKLEGKYVRLRSVDNILEEIQLRIKQYLGRGFRYLYFFDDTFILDKQFVNELCQKYKKNGFDKQIKWTANVRANLVTDELMKMMKGAGCYEVRMGVESGNDYILNTVYKRNMTKDQLVEAFKIITNNGLRLRLDFILGAPDETLEMMEESFDLAKNSGGDQVFFSRLYLFPGTEIKEICEKEKTVESDFDVRTKGFHAVQQTKFVSNGDIKNIGRKISWWQMQRYIDEGFRLKGISFPKDVLTFLFYHKWKYGLEFNQIYRWNIQRYKLHIV
jgi:anaerobic magnesium-protoporphyrin IX monomethyl ester cyclase